MRTCRNHPNREAVKGYRLCLECKKSYQQVAQKRYSLKLMSNWEELNLKNLLSDASRLTLDQLASRYKISRESVRQYLKKYNLKSKCAFTGGVHCKAKIKGSVVIPDMTEACAYIYPNHSY